MHLPLCTEPCVRSHKVVKMTSLKINDKIVV